MSAKKKAKVEVAPAVSLKLDLACGKNKKEGFIGVDQFQLPGVDVIHDLKTTWPWPDNSVEEANVSHFIEHLTNFDDKWERIHFFNELWRVMKPGAKCAVVIPHWCSNRYYGDPTHKEPFSEMGFYYLNKEWRLSQVPQLDVSVWKDGYSCDFDFTCVYTINPALASRNQETQTFFLTWYKEAALDLFATLSAKKA